MRKSQVSLCVSVPSILSFFFSLSHSCIAVTQQRFFFGGQAINERYKRLFCLLFLTNPESSTGYGPSHPACAIVREKTEIWPGYERDKIGSPRAGVTRTPPSCKRASAIGYSFGLHIVKNIAQWQMKVPCETLRSLTELIFKAGSSK